MPPRNRPTARIVVAVLLALTAAAGLANLAPEETPPADPAAAGPATVRTEGRRPAWEYRAMPRSEVIELAPGHKGEYIQPDALMNDLNAGLEVLGADGWELVSVDPYHTEGYVRWPSMYLFRRTK